MKKLIILRGNSGSGKTTVAKELQKRFGKNTMLIAQDAIRREMLWVNDGENTPALPLMKELLRYGNQHCEVVILEGIMNVEWYQSLFDLALQLYGTRVYAYYFDIPFEETLRRHQTRAKCNEFGEEEMRKWWRENDFAKELKENSITTEEDMERIVEDILDMVSNG